MKSNLLIIFLLLLSSCGEKIDDAYVSVNLPDKDQKEEVKEEVNISIFIYPQTYKYLDDELDLTKMEEELKKIDKEQTINIKVDQGTDHQRLVDLLQIMNKIGLSQFNLHTLKKPLKETEDP